MENLKTQNNFFGGVFKSKSSGSQSTEDEKMKPTPSTFFRRLPNGPRNHFVAMCGEFVGTFMFLLLAFGGTQVAAAATALDEGGSKSAQYLYISLAFGFSLAVNAWVFFRVSGGLFNPAVTLGLCMIGGVPFVRGGLVFISQISGAIAAAGVTKGLYPGPLVIQTNLSQDVSVAQGLFIEMFLTAQLVFTIFMLAAEKHKGTYLAPIGIGLSLFICELAGVWYTGGSLNPARSFGPCVVTATFPRYHWIYWIGPLLGSLLAATFFWFIKACEYETANPGQDFNEIEDENADPERPHSRPAATPSASRDRNQSRDLEGQRSNQQHDGARDDDQYAARRSRDREARRNNQFASTSPSRTRGYTIGSGDANHKPDGGY